jgi:hypothetical protein
MSKATEPLSAYIESPEYRRIVYRWIRQETHRTYRRHPISRRPALEAWRLSQQYVEAIR